MKWKLLFIVLLLVTAWGCTEETKTTTVIFEGNKIQAKIPYVVRFNVWYSTEYGSIDPWSLDVQIKSPCGDVNIKSKYVKTLDKAIEDVYAKASCLSECKTKQEVVK